MGVGVAELSADTHAVGELSAPLRIHGESLAKRHEIRHHESNGFEWILT